MTRVFRYSRRVQFAETDLAGIVHFSWMFRYMEEAEHALWRAAGLAIAGRDSDIGWPRVSAAFEFKRPLHFEEEFEVAVRLAAIGARSLHYHHTIVRGDTIIGTGTMTSVCTRKTAGGLRAISVPPDVGRRLRALLKPSSR